jgi:hypothetical protein
MIPVIINNRDIDPRGIVKECWRLAGPLGVVHLIDNESTYDNTLAALDYWDEFSGRAFPAVVYGIPIVHRWPNTGPRAACRLVNQMREEWTRQGVEFYATTDSDLDLTGVPSDLLTQCSGWLRNHPKLVKAGCALRLGDLPDTPQGRLARESEAKHWANRAFEWVERRDVYSADIDTTLAVYRLNPPWDGSYGPSVRLAGAYQARHLPWYQTDANRPPDHQWYLDHCDPQGTFYTAMEKAR